ncbi:hypothetical protein ACHAXA_000376 [Cyclostephanos tholiformis]|uniref:Impact N-terminal domain-containing protein n=1 Tax=Cyclostephanos tholiformis TaxID=382380 RepID=A0ABD3R6D1_9STRA
MEEEGGGDIQQRRAEELEALRAYYGDDLIASDDPASSFSSSSSGAVIVGAQRPPPPPNDCSWYLRLRRRRRRRLRHDEGGRKDDDFNNDVGGAASIIGLEPTLEIRLSSSYPLGDVPPEPILHNVMMDPNSMRDLLRRLGEMYECGCDIGIAWGDACIETLEGGNMTCAFFDVARGGGGGGGRRSAEMAGGTRNDASNDGGGDGGDGDSTGPTRTTRRLGDVVDGRTRTFVPPNGTRYGQPIRHFPSDIVSPNSAHRVNITRTRPFKPPRSGPAELMIAHVCRVDCIEQVQWALAELLFNDGKVQTAAHNMFAYRFRRKDDGTLVCDNDDDGERGSGNKLASLLDVSRAENVLVVVSRWFGGVRLGSSRFKWIASVARDGLELGGFIKG